MLSFDASASLDYPEQWIRKGTMAKFWKQVQALLEPPKHPGDAKAKVEPITAELQAARAAWQSEQTIVNAVRYITLLELSIRAR